MIYGTIALLVLAIGYSVYLLRWKREQFWQWSHTFLATVLSVFAALLIGLFLYSYQSKVSDDNERRQLLDLLDAETSLELMAFEAEPSMTFQFMDRKDVEGIVMTQLEPLIIEEAIKSGLFADSESLLMIKIVHNLRLYNSDYQYMLSLLGSTSDNLCEASAQTQDIFIKLAQTMNDARWIIIDQLCELRKELGFKNLPICI